MHLKNRILQESLVLINQAGASETGVREIARQLNISAGNLSYHFPRKRDLMEQLWQLHWMDIKQRMEQYTAADSDLYDLMQLINDILIIQYRYRGMYACFDPPPAWRPEFQRKLKLLVVEMSEHGYLQGGSEDLEFLSRSLYLYLFSWISDNWKPNPHSGVADLLKPYLLIVLRQLQLFSSSSGKISLLKFRSSLG